MIGYLAQGQALAAESGNVLFYFIAYRFPGFLQVCLFVIVPFKREPEETLLFDDTEKADMGVTIVAAGIALLDLLNVALASIQVALANGKSAVGKVDEHFAALQVVHCNWVKGVPFWGMRQH